MHLWSPHLTRGPDDAKYAATHLGQAHIAGTGPAGKTCRECIHWSAKHVRRYGDGSLRNHQCHYPILNKARNAVPHDAPACRFFMERDNTISVDRPTRRR